MPRQGFLTVPISETTQSIFDDFVKEKNLTKTSIMTDAIEMYMMALDEKLFTLLKKKHLHVEKARESILMTVLDEKVQVRTYDTYLFMKLGSWVDDNDITRGGEDTIQIYLRDEAKRGFTWFSTESLYNGMSKKQILNFKKAISSGLKVHILFGYGKTAGGENEIYYIADILDIASSAVQQFCPEEIYPEEFGRYRARIWIKIENIMKIKDLSVDDFQIVTTRSPLRYVISNGQFHFGYVKLKDEHNSKVKL